MSADHGGLSDRRVPHQGMLDLRSGESVSRDIHHVVDPTQQPHVAVVVALGPIASEVHAVEL